MRHRRIYYTAAHRAEIWDRWQRGESMSSIGRNGDRDGYRGTVSDQAAWDRALRPKVCKLACHPALRRTVSAKLRRKWSPEQIAGWLKRSFPDEEQKFATVSGHHTPRTLGPELLKYKSPKDLPTLLYHIKPVFQAKVEREVARLKGVNLTVLNLGDHFIL